MSHSSIKEGGGSTANWQPACPICAAPSRIRFSGLYDDRYGAPGRFPLRECDDCGHQFLEHRFTSAELGRLYTDFYPRSTRTLERWRPAKALSWWRERIGRESSSVFRWVPTHCRVLDVGCGFGESLGYHRQRGCEAWGIEADENIRRVADRFGFNARVGLFRAADFPSGYFDFVTLDQVIEHAADPGAMLRDAHAVLRPGGWLLLATPNARSLSARVWGRCWVHLHTPYHLQLFCARSLRLAARDAGYEVVSLVHLTNPRWYGFQWLHLLARPEPGQPSLFWSEGVWPAGRKAVRRAVSLLGRIGINHALAAVLDALHEGDNLVVVLRKPLR